MVEEEDAVKMSAAAVTGAGDVMQQQPSAELSVTLPAPRPATVSSVNVAKARVAEAAPLADWVSAKRPSKWFGHT